jgi:hypothetical protein
MVPSELRKEVGLHPETFKRLVADLDEFALMAVRAMPGQQGLGRKRSGSLTVRIGLEITESGTRLLDVVRDVRATVQRHVKSLPDSSVQHWLPG